MQVVTKITRQKKVKDRYNIFLNDAYAFSVSEDIFVKYRLYKGKQVSLAEIEQIQYDENFHRYYLLAIHYLSYRMRSEREVRDYLAEKELDPQLIELVIEKLYEKKLLDDIAFAKTFVKDRIRRTTKGPLIIKNELNAKGIKATDIKLALLLYNENKQLEQALKWATKEANKKSKHPFYKRKEQIKIKLMRRGFSQHIAFQTINEIELNKDENEEWELLKKEANKLYTKYKRKYDEQELRFKMKQGLYNRGFDIDSIELYLNDLHF